MLVKLLMISNVEENVTWILHNILIFSKNNTSINMLPIFTKWRF